MDVDKRIRMVNNFLREYNWMNTGSLEGIFKEKVLVYKNEESLFIHGIYYIGSNRDWMNNVKDSLVKEYNLFNLKERRIKDEHINVDKFIEQDDEQLKETVINFFE